jgi:hypothetical protein
MRITNMKGDDKIAVLVREMNAVFRWAELSAKLLAKNASPAVQAARLAYLKTIKPYKWGTSPAPQPNRPYSRKFRRPSHGKHRLQKREPTLGPRKL